ncbi:MAG: acyltransferase family protein [Sarcina sp.]
MKYLIFNQFNLIKIFCCFLVVYQHIIGAFLNTKYATILTHSFFGTIFNFSRFAVPIFMIISGFLLIKSYKNLSLKEFYKTKFSKFLFLYLIANFIFMFPYIIGKFTFRELLEILIFGKSSPHLWYMHTLLLIYLLYPIFKYIVMYLNKLFGIYSILVITFIQYIISKNIYEILNKSTLAIFQMMFKYLDRSLFIWGYYFILGGLIYLNFEKIRKFINNYIKILFPIFIIDFIYIIYYTTDKFNFINVNYYRSSPSSFNILIYSLLSFMVLYYTADKLIQKDILILTHLIDIFSNYILFIYILHPILISISYLILLLSNILPHDFVTILAICVSFLFTLVPFYIYHSKKKVKSASI